MSDYTLVVVDMQPKFSASKSPRTINQCKNAVIKAVKDKAGIVVVEFVGCGKTRPSITKFLKKYNGKQTLVLKDSPGGGEEVRRAVRHLSMCRKIKICGVNRSYCVKATAFELYDFGYSVELLDKATNCTRNEYKESCIAQYKDKGCFVNTDLIVV